MLLAPAALPGEAAAQDVPQIISPLRVETDHNDVNMATGKTAPASPILSVPAAPNLSFDRVQNAAPYMRGRVSGGPGDLPVGNYSVHAGGAASDSFLCSDTVDCASVTGTGSTFRPMGLNSYRYQQAGSGAVYTFNLMHANAGGPPRNVQYYASRVAWPNGETISYDYDTIVHGGLTYYRPATLTSNMGYAIALAYKGNDFAADPTGWASVATATLHAGDTGSPPLRRLTYGSGTVTDSGDTVADTSDDRVYGCTGCGGTLGVEVEAPSATLRLPGETAAAVQAAAHPAAQVVASVTRDGVTWTYAYQNLRQEPGNPTWLFDRVTVTGPNGFSQSYQTMQGGPVKSRFNAVTGITDPLGRTSSYQIEPVTMRVVRVTAPEGDSVSVQYDEAGNIVRRTRHAKPGTGLTDVAQTAGYALPSLANLCNVACWRPNWSVDALGRRTDYLYNGNGQLVRQDEPADADGVRRRTIVDYAPSPVAGISRRSAVRICGVPSPGSGQGGTCGTSAEIRTEYQYRGDTPLVTRERRIDGATGAMLDTVYEHDAQGRLKWTDGPLPGDGDRTYNRYDAHGRRIWEIGARAPTGLRIATRSTYRDADDKLLSSEMGTIPDPDSNALTVIRRVDHVYDGRRNLARRTVSAPSPGPGQGAGTALSVVDTYHDDRGLLLCSAVRMNPAAFAQTPGACAPTTQGPQGPDRVSVSVYDAAGQLLQDVRAYGTALQQNYAVYTYSDNGRRTSVTDGNGNRAEMTYDGFDRLARWTLPSPTVPGAVNPADHEDYTYDDADNRLTLRKRDGSVLTFQYDQLNRMIAKLVPERLGLDAIHTRDVFYAYDLRNAQLYARFGGHAGEGVTNSYDAFGRPLSSTLLMDGASRTLGRTYDDVANRVTLTYPEGQQVTYAFDALGRLGQLFEGAGTATLLTQLSHNPQGLLAAREERHGSVASFGHDALGRLTMQMDAFPGGTGTVSSALGYNPAGQITSTWRDNDAYAWTGAYNVNRNYAVNGLNQYTTTGPPSGPPTATFAYDGNGNLTSDGTNTYLYDVENRLVGRASNVSLRYDPLGRLYEVTGPSGTTRFLYDGDALVAEYVGGQLTARYVHGTDSAADDPLIWYDSAGTRHWLHRDHQGSITGITNGSGAIQSINAYDEYGIPKAGNTGRFQYTGQIWIAELGMYHYKARLYSPTLGRFMQTDPVGYEDQVNLYAYVMDDPVNLTDPTGERVADPCTGSRLECGGRNGGLCFTCAGRGGLGHSKTESLIERSGVNFGESNRAEEGEQIQTACVGILTFLRSVCGSLISPLFGPLARAIADKAAQRLGLTINRTVRIGSGGRSGGNLGNLVGPANSVVAKPGGNGLWFTNSRGQVVRDLTFTGEGARVRAFEVVPGRGAVGPRLDLTPVEWRIWRGF